LIGAHLQAQTAYERALAINPGEPTVLSNDALSHMEVGDLDTAERLLMEASQNGADPRIKQNLAMIHDMKARAPQPATPMPLAMLPVQADGAMQPNLETMLEVAPLVDVTPAPDVAASVPVATSDDMWQEDQATRGETIALDPAVADEPQAPVVAVETMESPKQDDTATKPETTAAPAKKSPTKTVSAKAAKPKPTAKTAPSSKPLHGPRGNDEVPATQTASGK